MLQCELTLIVGSQGMMYISTIIQIIFNQRSFYKSITYLWQEEHVSFVIITLELPKLNKIIKMNNRNLWGEFSEDKNVETTEAEIREDKEIYKKKKEDLKILNSK